MSFEVLQESKPAFPAAAMVAIIVLAAALLCMAAAFAWLLLSGTGSNYELGTLLAFEFLIAAVMVVLYAKYFIPFREVSEDREEELLW